MHLIVPGQGQNTWAGSFQRNIFIDVKRDKTYGISVVLIPTITATTTRTSTTTLLYLTWEVQKHED